MGVTACAVLFALAQFIAPVRADEIETEHLFGFTTGSDVGTGGMATKLHAAKIATESGADMVIANADDVEVMWRILKGEEIGTLFKANKSSEFALLDYIQSIHA